MIPILPRTAEMQLIAPISGTQLNRLNGEMGGYTHDVMRLPDGRHELVLPSGFTGRENEARILTFSESSQIDELRQCKIPLLGRTQWSVIPEPPKKAVSLEALDRGVAVASPWSETWESISGVIRVEYAKFRRYLVSFPSDPERFSILCLALQMSWGYLRDHPELAFFHLRRMLARHHLNTWCDESFS